MTQNKRRTLHAARHAHIYQPSTMKSKTLDFLEIFILQSQCRINELYTVLSKYIDRDLSQEDQEMFWAFQQDLATLQGDISTLISIKDLLSGVDAEFEKAGKEITKETVTLYLQQSEYNQDPKNEDIRSKLEKLL